MVPAGRGSTTPRAAAAFGQSISGQRGRLLQRHCARPPLPRRIPALSRAHRSEGEHLTAYGESPTRGHQIWAAHNPYDLAQDLLTTPLFISVGNGQPGPLNPGGTLDRVEEALHAENVAFRARLTQVGAAATFDFYGPGSHDWRTGSASCTAPGPSSATHSPEPHQTGSDLRQQQHLRPPRAQIPLRPHPTFGVRGERVVEAAGRFGR
jgi:hypothetical protein